MRKLLIISISMLIACRTTINSIDIEKNIIGKWLINHTEDTLIFNSGRFEYTHTKETGEYAIKDSVIIFSWILLERHGNNFELKQKHCRYRFKFQVDYLQLKFTEGSRLINDNMTLSKFFLLERIN